jgi:hypothetical protein
VVHFPECRDTPSNLWTGREAWMPHLLMPDDHRLAVSFRRKFACPLWPGRRYKGRSLWRRATRCVCTIGKVALRSSAVVLPRLGCERASMITSDGGKIVPNLRPAGCGGRGRVSVAQPRAVGRAPPDAGGPAVRGRGRGDHWRPGVPGEE